MLRPKYLIAFRLKRRPNINWLTDSVFTTYVGYKARMKWLMDNADYSMFEFVGWEQ